MAVVDNAIVAMTRSDPFLQFEDAEAARLGLLFLCPWHLVLLLFLAWFHGGTSLQEMG
jgi:hypothetical protein